MKLNGSQILLEVLLEQGVDTIFGYPGGAVLNLYDALYDYSDRIHHVLTAHEQGASHAADGYARSTGKTGVVIATSARSHKFSHWYCHGLYGFNSIGRNHRKCIYRPLGRDSFQEVYITGITMPITNTTLSSGMLKSSLTQ